MARVSDVSIDEVPDSARSVYRRFADEGMLDKRHLEIALVTVSRLNECDYCVSHHAPRLMAEGLARETVERILEPDCPGLDDVERLVRDYAVQVTHDARRVSDAQFTAMRDHFSEAQMVELTLRIALCGFFNRFNDAMRIEMEEGVTQPTEVS